jgi:uncharacterized SAM-binding protein YcdF (DUF218 family)
MRRRLAVIAGAGAFLLMAGGAFFVAAGALLVERGEVRDADLAVVLSGEPVTRALAARDLYRAGQVRAVLVIPEPRRAALVEAELRRLGLEEIVRGRIAERILAAGGVSPEALAVLHSPADGTIVEARRVRAFLRERPARRIAVVTSTIASRRACFIFRRVLDGVDVVCAPNPYDGFDRGRWWRQPRHALLVLMEYQKLVANSVMLAAGAGRD